jgi:Methyltransferase domain
MMKLYVGSRDLKPDGYLTVDIDPATKPDIVADITNMPSVKDSSCDEIRASHVLEHLEWPNSFKALAEFARVLKLGGVLEISVPDVRLLLEMMVSGESDFFATGLLYGLGGRINRFEAHRYGFTERMLRHVLGILGFGDFDWWSSSLPECANGWSPANGGAQVAVSVNMAARKIAAPMADPALVYEALLARHVDDPRTVVADLLGQKPDPGSTPLDVSVYQRIHFQLIYAQQRIKYLEDELRRMGESGRRAG